MQLVWKWRDVDEHSGVVLVQAEEMSAVRTRVVPERVRTLTHKTEGPVLPARWTLLDLRHDLGQPSSFLESSGGIRESWSRSQGNFTILHGRGVRPRGSAVTWWIR